MKWTEQEKTRLRAMYGTMDAQAIAQTLGRSRMAVLKMAGKLALDGMPMRWGDGEKALLTLIYPTTPVPDLCRLLGRREHQIRAMAHTLGLKRTAQAKSDAAYRRLPVGSERPNQHGQMMRKVKESGPYRQAWKRVDILTWEAAHGPVPKGMIVTLRDRTKPPTLDNLMLVDRGGLAKMNHPDRAHPPEVVELIRLQASITRQVNTLARRQAAG